MRSTSRQPAAVAAAAVRFRLQAMVSMPNMLAEGGHLAPEVAEPKQSQRLATHGLAKPHLPAALAQRPFLVCGLARQRQDQTQGELGCEMSDVARAAHLDAQVAGRLHVD